MLFSSDISKGEYIRKQTQIFGLFESNIVTSLYNTQLSESSVTIEQNYLFFLNTSDLSCMIMRLVFVCALVTVAYRLTLFLHIEHSPLMRIDTFCRFYGRFIMDARLSGRV